jgi:hypothetical protein
VRVISTVAASLYCDDVIEATTALEVFQLVAQGFEHFDPVAQTSRT